MQLENQTPFPALMYSAADPDRVEHRIVVMKVSYKIIQLAPGQCDLELIQDGSIPLCLEDEFWGEIGQSSVRLESDLAPYKPKCDVIINGLAYTPQAKAMQSIAVRLRLSVPAEKQLIKPPIAPQPLNPNMPLTASQKHQWQQQQDQYQRALHQNQQIKFKKQLEKTLSIVGESQFKPNTLLPGWSRTKPKQFTTLPLRWESTFGGSQLLSAQNTATGTAFFHQFCYSNPLGTGWIDQAYFKACEEVNKKRPRKARIKGFDIIPAPQIEYHLQRQPKPAVSKQEKLTTLTAQKMAKVASKYPYRPAGFGFTARSWAPRLALAGTYDDDWLENQHPYPPQDIDYAYWNGAPVDQQIDFFYPNSRLELWNLMAPAWTKNGYMCLDFKGHRPYISLHFQSGETVLWPMITETVLIDTDNMTISLTHKAWIEAGTAPLSYVEACFSDEAEGELMQMSEPHSEQEQQDE